MGGSSSYETVVRLPIEEGLVYLVYRRGIVEEASIESSGFGTETFSSNKIVLDLSNKGSKSFI